MHLATLRKVGGIRQLGDSFAPYSDTLIPIQLVEFGKVCWLDEPLVFLRTHEDSLTCKSGEFSAYTSAEVDFLEILQRICASENVSVEVGRIIANMVRWFAKDELAVLCRLFARRKYDAYLTFIKYQLGTNLPRLTLGFKIGHILFSLRLLGSGLFFDLYGKIRSIGKSV